MRVNAYQIDARRGCKLFFYLYDRMRVLMLVRCGVGFATVGRTGKRRAGR